MLSRRSPRPPFEELIIYALLVLTGAIAVRGAIVDRGPVGVEATLGFLMIVTGLAGIAGYLWRARRGRAS